MAEFDDRRRGSPSGEEELRFIRNFHDIFLSIGLAMFAVGLGIVSFLILGNITDAVNGDEWRTVMWRIAGTAAVDAVIMWMLGEIFARTRRLFLPSIVILIAFLSFVFWATSATYIGLFGEHDYGEFEDAFDQLKAMPMIIAAVMTAATLLFYLRTKLPFSMGVMGMGLAATGVGVLVYQDAQKVVEYGAWVALISGLFLFVLGVYFDARDPARKTRISDNGFWLHFFAAPLIFTSTIQLATGARMGASQFGTGAAATTLTVVIVFAIISLLINRRALLVSGLLSAAFAIGILVKQTGLDGAWTAALTLLLLGGAMVLLGGGWHTVRRALVAPFPKTGLMARIVPPEPPPGGAAADHGE